MKRKLLVSLAALLPIVLGLLFATQWTAAKLQYRPLLGEPMLNFRAQPVYSPWKIVAWDLAYGASYPELFSSAYWFIYGGVVLSTAFVGAVSAGRRRGSRSTIYGSARWASDEELESSGLLASEGVILGMTKDGRYIRHNGPEHVKVIAPTRSGKGVGIVIPTLLTWPESVIVYDLKSENWKATAGYRERFSRTIYFNPNDSDSAHFNPLSEVRLGNLEVRDAQNIADMIVDPAGLGFTDHWAKTGHSLLVGAILHVLYAGSDKTLAGVANFLSNPAKSLETTLQEMLKAEHSPAGTHPVVASAARDMLNKSENERSGVFSTAMSFLSLYRDPIVRDNTSESDFKITDLMQSDEPISLYLAIPPSDINRLRPLFRLIINQICRRLTEELNPEQNRYRLLMLLDEFPALGRLEFFESALGVIAGYGLKAMLISQSISQLEKTYGANNSIMDHSHVRVLFAPNTLHTAEVASRMLGQKTEVQERKSHGGSRFSFWLDRLSVSDVEVARPLLTPGEVLELPYTDELIFLAGRPPIRAKKVFYYRDRNFLSRIVAPPSLKKQTPPKGSNEPGSAAVLNHQPEPVSDPEMESFDDPERKYYGI